MHQKLDLSYHRCCCKVRRPCSTNLNYETALATVILTTVVTVLCTHAAPIPDPGNSNATCLFNFTGNVLQIETKYQVIAYSLLAYYEGAVQDDDNGSYYKVVYYRDSKPNLINSKFILNISSDAGYLIDTCLCETSQTGANTSAFQCQKYIEEPFPWETFPVCKWNFSRNGYLFEVNKDEIRYSCYDPGSMFTSYPDAFIPNVVREFGFEPSVTKFVQTYHTILLTQKIENISYTVEVSDISLLGLYTVRVTHYKMLNSRHYRYTPLLGFSDRCQYNCHIELDSSYQIYSVYCHKFPRKYSNLTIPDDCQWMNTITCDLVAVYKRNVTRFCTPLVQESTSSSTTLTVAFSTTKSTLSTSSTTTTTIAVSSSTTDMTPTSTIISTTTTTIPTTSNSATISSTSQKLLTTSRSSSSTTTSIPETSTVTTSTTQETSITIGSTVSLSNSSDPDVSVLPKHSSTIHTELLLPMIFINAVMIFFYLKSLILF